MRGKKLSIELTAALAILAVSLFLAGTSFGQGPHNFKVLHNFNGTDGVNNAGPMILDAAGNLYGVASSGGLYGNGTVFELSPTAAGGRAEKVLHNFGSRDNDGVGPNAPLIFDGAGNLYGTTYYGGAIGGHFGTGTVFELSPTAAGSWAETVLYNFPRERGNVLGGIRPTGSVIFDAAGNLYGTTDEGGANQRGEVFELSPSASGSWTLKVLYAFVAAIDGIDPGGTLVFDAAGNLYGPNWVPLSCGMIYELTPTASGSWTDTLVYRFNNAVKDGCFPGSVIIDPVGNLYGTTCCGGKYGGGSPTTEEFGGGMAFELTPAPGGGWNETVLHTFGGTHGGIPDGINPNGVIRDAGGNLYGSTGGGGEYGFGIVFELTPASDGSWTKKVLHTFEGADGEGPGGLVLDSAGNLYGATGGGGANGYGTVFELTP